MKLARRAFFALPLLALFVAPADAAPKRHHKAAAGHGSWDGRWAGAWGGNHPTAVIVKGEKVVAYEYGGHTHTVSSSHVTPKQIVYGHDPVVTIRRTGANAAHATIKSGQGNGTAELTRN